MIEATAPTRIDLAGGTLDIFPLYVFEGGGITVNAAITLNSSARIMPRQDHRVVLSSEDLGTVVEADSFDQLPEGGVMDLAVRILKFYRPSVGVNVELHSSVPKGSGLGGSSSLLISLSAALNELNGGHRTLEDLINLGANLEAQSLRIPTGKQDYYPPAFGGINAIWFNIDGNVLEPLTPGDETLGELEERLVLTYTAESRFSGTSNWNMMKQYIDNVGATVANLRRIKQTAVEMRQAIIERDLDRFAKLLSVEWENRKRLAQGVTTPRIDQLITEAHRRGGIASKICGAGGGGCMITFVQPGSRQDVIAALATLGAEDLPFGIARSGVKVSKN